MKKFRPQHAIAGLLASLSATFAWAAEKAEPWQLNMTPGVTATAERAYDMHMIMLWICVVIGIVVFGAMAYSIVKFRKSKGAVPDKTFVHSTKLEIVWTAIPTLILVVMAYPATVKVIEAYDTKDHEMTVKIIGQQWLWTYEYVGEGVSFTSRLDRQSDRLRQSGVVVDSSNPNYLLDVDNRLVLPTDTKIRFIITADDVIHAWWVPALGWKSDAIPGIVNEQWTEIREPGIYRGQCAELCGKDHGFMPIVVEAVPKAEFQARLAAMKSANDETARTASAVPAAAGPQG
ncbi:cytochrome c oxidase subunit II [Silanimonas sp.]|jgi:cytochrome c oxidase subunit 2|uniref:cytochrome c oxidase subunit II n=1 Tax=Silanimonas sp. TaxID=1929290 RepID=UPI0037CC7910